MEVNAMVPNVVLHFHGFRLSMLSNLEEALCHLAVDMLRKMIIATAASGACVVASQAARMAVPVLADGFVSGLITFATFSSCTVLAQGPAQLMHKQLPPSQSYYIRGAHDTDVAAAKAVAATASPSTLPLLSAKRLAPISYTATAQTTAKRAPKLQPSSASAKTLSAHSKASPLPLIRRRVLNHLRQGPPIVNVVAGETRRRAQMSLLNANIRVGKAHTQLRTASGKPQDFYMVRVDCGSSSGSSSNNNEKHMNPVVMWDITATFDEFKALERELKREVKTKKLRASVPHLSTGAVLFVQEELTTHVLNARRTRLQAFIDAIRTDAELASTDCLRKFCQAY